MNTIERLFYTVQNFAKPYNLLSIPTISAFALNDMHRRILSLVDKILAIYPNITNH